MNDLNRRLQETFLFTSADVRANRAGRLSPRQQARLRAASGSQRLAMVVFVVVMVGTLAIIAFGALISRAYENVPTREMLLQMGIIAGVVGGVILVGLLSSRRYLTDPAPRRMLMAAGPARPGKIRPDAAHFEVRIGAAGLRLLTEDQLLTFQPGVEYRVFYLPGPTPHILSAEVIGTEAEADAAPADEPAALEQDAVLQIQGRARPVLLALAALTLGIPLAGFAASYLTGSLRWLIMAALLAAAIAFVFWALRRLKA